MDKKIENCKQQLKKHGQTALIRGSGSGFRDFPLIAQNLLKWISFMANTLFNLETSQSDSDSRIYEQICSFKFNFPLQLKSAKFTINYVKRTP